MPTTFTCYTCDMYVTTLYALLGVCTGPQLFRHHLFDKTSSTIHRGEHTDMKVDKVPGSRTLQSVGLGQKRGRPLKFTRRPETILAIISQSRWIALLTSSNVFGHIFVIREQKTYADMVCASARDCDRCND
ncbi:hypothetical protein Bbelb_059350 [Branchiostoma belcheri]|nr:hypothetical protein Bbelb_059350 [Branchiostoma belcheri]